MNPPTQNPKILEEFGKIATELGAQLSVTDNYCSISKNGMTIHAVWSVDGITGVFVTLLNDGATSGPFKHGYGLSYLVDFLGGNELDLEKAKSDDLKEKVELAKKYAVGFLDGSLRDFDDFADFAEARVQANIKAKPPLPAIKTNRTVRAEWI